jgi:hypothetical protein
MRCVLRGLSFLACAAAVCAQQRTDSKAPNGLETDWDIAVVLEQITAQAERLLPELDKIDVKSWVERGASDTYLKQVESAKIQTRAIADGAKALARNPERLSASLEVYIRIQAQDRIVRSLVDGLRRFGNQFAAEDLISVAAKNDVNRDRLQQYLVNLAAQREQELAVMDREAQRCRGLVTQAPANQGRKK